MAAPTGANIAAESRRHQTKRNLRYPEAGNTNFQYAMGGNGPWKFDCSGYLIWLHDKFGIDVQMIGGGARSAAIERWLVEEGTKISVQEGIATPGAWLVRDGHMEISLGNVHLDSMGARNYDIDLAIASAFYCRAERAYLLPGVTYTRRTHVPVQLGDNGQAVRHVQQVLRIDGYKGPNGKLIVVDNDFGSYSDYAVRQWQKDHRLVQDGVAGPITQSAMQVTYRTA